MMLPILRGETVCHNTEGHPFNFSEEVVEDLMHWVRSSNNYGYWWYPARMGVRATVAYCPSFLTLYTRHQ